MESCSARRARSTGRTGVPWRPCTRRRRAGVPARSRPMRLRGAVPGLDDALALGPLEPLGEMGVGDDPPAAGQRLVPLGAVQGDRAGPRRARPPAGRGRPTDARCRFPGGEFAVDGTGRVGELAAVEAGVEDGGAGCGRGDGTEDGVPLAPDALPVRSPVDGREGAAGLQDEPVVVAPLEGEVPVVLMLLPGQGAVQGGAEPERPVRLRVPLPRRPQEEVPAPLGERQCSAGPFDGGWRDHGPEVVAVSRSTATTASSWWPLWRRTSSCAVPVGSGKAPSRPARPIVPRRRR